MLIKSLLRKFCNEGLKLLVSSDLSRKNDLTTWMFCREDKVISHYGFACIGIRSTDKLLFIGFPPQLNALFEHVATQNWPSAVQKVKKTKGTFEIKLNGTPWLSRSGRKSIQSKTLIMALINALDRHDWFVFGSSNLKDTADTLFFTYQPYTPATEPRSPAFVLCMNKNDRLQVFDAQPHIVDCIKKVLLDHWPGGLKRDKQKLNTHDFMLYGQDGICTRYVFCKLFEALLTKGWRVHVAIDLARRLNGNSLFMFQHCVPMSASIFCLSLNFTDRIRFINTPPDVIEILSAEIRKHWLFGIQREECNGISKEIQLYRNPWSYGLTGHDGAHGRVLLCRLLKMCASMGWFIIVSADVSVNYSRSRYPLDVQSWWFMQLSSQHQQFATSRTPSMAPGDSSPAEGCVDEQS